MKEVREDAPESSSLPDPDNPKWHDKCYYFGDSLFERLPIFQDIAESIAPDNVLETEGALEKSCTLLIIANLFVLLSYLYFGVIGYRTCVKIEFLSLVQNPDYCVEVKNAMNDKYALDDNGYWESRFQWAFADSMCGANFVDFETTEEEWQKSYAKNLWKVYDDWNEKWSSQTSIDNLMAMVVSEKKVTGNSVILAQVLADPIALMNSNFRECIAVNNLLTPDGSFSLTYSDRGNNFYLSAVYSEWVNKLPKWKFSFNVFEDDALKDDGTDPTQGVVINKYSLWVAAAVNMGIIDLSDLTKLDATGFTSTYGAVGDDDDDSTDDSSGGSAAASADGAVCTKASFYKDGYCDSVNNVAACLYDGGDCCESTCGKTYETDTECGTGGYNCLNPSASDYGSSETVTADDDTLFDDAESTEYTYYNDDGESKYSYDDGAACTWYTLFMQDSGCDGWEGNYLHVGKDKITLSSGCNATEYACMTPGTYKPYACGGNYPSEISWSVVESSDENATAEWGGGSELCDWEYCGSVKVVVEARRRLQADKVEGDSLIQRHRDSKQQRIEDAKTGKRRLQASDPTPAPSVSPKPSVTSSPTPAPSTPSPAPSTPPTSMTNAPSVSSSPTSLPTPKPSVSPYPSASPTSSQVPTSTPIPAPTTSPTIDYRYDFGLTDYVLFKYYDEMDPIQCANVNGSQYCWVKGNAGERGTEDASLGAYLFPIIQHFNSKCYNCSATASNNDDDCNEVDMEVLLFFNPLLVSEPHFVHTYNASYREERRKYDLDNSGLDGVIYMNLYGGVKFLNSLFYKLPDTHCTKPIAIAKGAKTKNSQACGTPYQKSLIKSKKKSVKKAAKQGYCHNTPSAPQERYFECQYSPEQCVSQAIAQAAGQSAIVSVIIMGIIMYFIFTFLDVPKKQNPNSQQKLNNKNSIFGCLYTSFEKCFNQAKILKEKEEQRKKDEKMNSTSNSDSSDNDSKQHENEIGIALISNTKVSSPLPTLESLQLEQKILNDKIEQLVAASSSSTSTSSNKTTATFDTLDSTLRLPKEKLEPVNTTAKSRKRTPSLDDVVL